MIRLSLLLSPWPSYSASMPWALTTFAPNDRWRSLFPQDKAYFLSYNPTLPYLTGDNSTNPRPCEPYQSVYHTLAGITLLNQDTGKTPRPPPPAQPKTMQWSMVAHHEILSMYRSTLPASEDFLARSIADCIISSRICVHVLLIHMRFNHLHAQHTPYVGPLHPPLL